MSPSFKNSFLECHHGVSNTTLALPCACDDDDICIILKHTDSSDNEGQSNNYYYYNIGASTFPHSDFSFVCMFPVCICLTAEICVCTTSSLEGHSSTVKFLFQGNLLLVYPWFVQRDDLTHCCHYLISGDMLSFSFICDLTD